MVASNVVIKHILTSIYLISLMDMHSRLYPLNAYLIMGDI
jgi:hypothetical protein